MKILVTNHSVPALAARHLRARVAACPTVFKLGLPTGSTVEEMYTILRGWVQKKELDFSRTVTFNMDEYIGLAPVDTQSYYTYMTRHLFYCVRPLRRYHLDGLAKDLDAECARYENAIAQEGGIDLFIGGVGRNGHIAFNEPGTPFSQKTHVAMLAESTRRANARFFDNDILTVPTYALTVGIDTILRARELLFLATGASKAVAVAALEEKGTTPFLPLSALKLHPNATLLLDAEAAGGFSGIYDEKLSRARRENPNAAYWTIDTGEIC